MGTLNKKLCSKLYLFHLCFAAISLQCRTKFVKAKAVIQVDFKEPLSLCILAFINRDLSIDTQLPYTATQTNRNIISRIAAQRCGLCSSITGCFAENIFSCLFSTILPRQKHDYCVLRGFVQIVKLIKSHFYMQHSVQNIYTFH